MANFTARPGMFVYHGAFRARSVYRQQPLSTTLPVPLRKRPHRPQPQLTVAQHGRDSSRTPASGLGIKNANQKPWWRQLTKVALLLPVVAAASFVKPPLSSAHAAWHFWQTQPAAQQQAQPAAWQGAETFAAAGAERWQRTMHSSAMRTAAVILCTFTMIYTLLTSIQEFPLRPEPAWMDRSYSLTAAGQHDDEPAGSREGSQQAAPSKHSRISPAAQPGAQLVMPAPRPIATPKSASIFQPMPGLRAIEPNRYADQTPDSMVQPTGTVDLPASPDMPMPSYSASIAGEPEHRSADSGEVLPSDIENSTTAAEPPRGMSPQQTVDMPMYEVPPVAEVSERVKEKAKQLEREEKEASIPPSPTDAATDDRNKAQPQASTSSAEALPQVSAALTGQQQTDPRSISAKPAAASFSTAADGVLKSVLQANPLGDFLDGMLQHKPNSNKYDILWDVLHTSRDKAGTNRNSKYDPVFALLQHAALEADWGTPKSGLVHDLLHIADAAHGPERRPPPAFLTALIQKEETQPPTPQDGLIHQLLHLGDRVGSTLQNLTDDLGNTIPMRADPVGSFLQSAESATDWEPQKWDPVAALLKGVSAHSSSLDSSAPSKYNPVASLAEAQAHGPISRPSKFDPLPGLLTSSASTSKPALDPLSGIMGLAIAHGNARAEARAKHVALAAPTQTASNGATARGHTSASQHRNHERSASTGRTAIHNEDCNGGPQTADRFGESSSSSSTHSMQAREGRKGSKRLVSVRVYQGSTTFSKRPY